MAKRATEQADPTVSPDRQSEPGVTTDSFLVRFLDGADDSTREVVEGLAALDRHYGNRPTPTK